MRGWLRRLGRLNIRAARLTPFQRLVVAHYAAQAFPAAERGGWLDLEA